MWEEARRAEGREKAEGDGKVRMEEVYELNVKRWQEGRLYFFIVEAKGVEKKS